MSPHLCARLLALPPTVRSTLAGVPGPGWYVSRRDGATALHDSAPYIHPEPLGQRGAGFTEAWLPANPAAAVAAVLGCEPWAAYVQIGEWMRGIAGIEHATEPGLDIEAALSIIENHVRSQT